MPPETLTEPLSRPRDAGTASVAVVGAGRLGNAIASALAQAGRDVRGPLRREESAGETDLVLLCVPDSEIERAAAAVPAGPMVGHCSGATGLDVLSGREGFSLHPLMTVTPEGAVFQGAGCAVAGTTDRALDAAVGLAKTLGMQPATVPDEDRAAYHAAASIASNFLVTLEAAAERLAASAGVDRALLGPLVRASVDNWLELGAERALTGPIARGDEATVARQRAAVTERTPDLLPFFDALVLATREVAGRRQGSAAEPHRLVTVRTVAQLRAALAPHRRTGRSIGLVPTMGALHEGHAALIRAAREASDLVVVSLFVNPAQFAPSEDFEAYPRNEAADAALCEELGADLLFAPPAEEVYPAGHATTVTVDPALTGVLCGAHRGPGHFAGVTTVVSKLFAMAAPDAAYFGQKDAQQAVVIRRMTRDLDLPVRIEVVPTVREPDGLALSSRNAYLLEEERPRALALRNALRAAEAAVTAGEQDAAAVLQAARAEMSQLSVEPEYLELVHPETLDPVDDVGAEALLAVAAHVGRTRLIDNTTLRPQGRSD